VGYVTSAGFGYSVGESLAYAYLPPAVASEGREVTIESFGDRLSATVASEPRWDPAGVRIRQ
jgi:glycine cleavage system aminomethyltransferase T